MDVIYKHTASDTIIIVEGKTDKARILQILAQPVKILCTQGTLSYEQFEEDIIPLQHDEVYILVDADDSGNRLRNQLKQALPNAKHLYTRRVYREVAHTPTEYLAKILHDAHFEVQPEFFLP